MAGTAPTATRAEVAERERRFFNTRPGRYQLLRELIWRSIGEFNRNGELRDLYDVRGKRVLLYGCGPTNPLQEMFDAGATHITGIDIADVDIAAANADAREWGYT
ncbi:MAG TPA: hypothetical protein VG365_03105, partial [Solirubrobacteraceae bacterium]|nr:hypothetical protein [Solirubrobacteraceae bacterium]